jgi:hypothetical protein
MTPVQPNMAADLSSRIDKVDTRQAETRPVARAQKQTVEVRDTVDISKEARLAAETQKVQSKRMPKPESVKKSNMNQNIAAVDKAAASLNTRKPATGVRMVLATGTFLRAGQKTTVNYLG